MSTPIKFPSARQPVTMVDGNGQEVFTRPWFLFFQAVYERAGGATGESNTDLAASAFEDAGTGETNAMLFQSIQDAQQSPFQQIAAAVEDLLAEFQAQRDRITELEKELQSIKQGSLL